MPHVALALAVSLIAQDAAPPAPPPSTSMPSMRDLPGVLPAFPLPIAGDGDMAPLIKRLRLSEAQASVAQDALIEYWQDWRAVQQSEFETYAPSQVLTASIFWQGPDRPTLSAYQAQHQRIAIALQTLDQALFDVMEKIMTDEQSAALGRERSRRELEYLVADPVVQAWFPSGRPLDLRDVVESHGFELNEAVAQVLTSHESQMLRQLKRVNNAIAEARTCWVEAVRDLDRTPVDPNAPPQEVMQHRDRIHAWAGCLLPASGMVGDCLRTTRDAATRIAKALPPEQSRRFEALYFARQFGEPFIIWHENESELDAVIAVEALDEAVRAKLIAARSRWYGEGRRLEWTVADGMIARFVRSPRGMSVGMGPPAQEEMAMNDALFAAEQQRLETMRMMQDVLPREVHREILGQLLETVIRPLQRLDPHANAPPRLITQRGVRTAKQPWIEAPGTRDIRRISGVVREYIDEAAMAAALRRTADGYAAANSELLSKTEVPPGPSSRDSIDPVRDRMDAMERLMAQLDALDEGLCVSIETEMNAPRTAGLLRLARLCARVNAVREAWIGASIGHAIDPTLAIATINDPDQEAQLALQVDLTNVVAPLRGLLAACMVFHRADELAQATRMLRPSNPVPEQWHALDDRVRASEDAYLAARSAMESTYAAFIVTQRQLIERLLSAATADARSPIIRSYAAQSFPGVFSDLTATANRIQRASGLSDLSIEQQTSLVEVAAEMNERIDAYLESVLPTLNAVAANADEHDDVDDAIMNLRMRQLGIDQGQIAGHANFSMNRVLTRAQRDALEAEQANRAADNSD